MASERLTRALHAEHRVPDDALAALTAEDVRDLEAAVSGAGERRYRLRAMDTLVAARGAGATRALAGLVGDRREPDTLRAAAASQLARVGRTGEQTLLAALDGDDAMVAMAAAGALARAGSAAAIERLAPFADREDLLGQQARFARTLIAFRSGMTGYEPPRASESQALDLPSGRRSTISLRRLRRDDAEAVIADLRRDALAVPLDPESAVGVECGGERLVLALGATAGEIERPAVVGAVARRAEAERSYSVRWMVLAWPVGAEPVEVGVFRLSGQQVMAGTATSHGARVAFELHAIEGRGNMPVEVRGAVQDGRLVELDGVSGVRRPERGTPTPE